MEPYAESVQIYTYDYCECRNIEYECMIFDENNSNCAATE